MARHRLLVESPGRLSLMDPSRRQAAPKEGRDLLGYGGGGSSSSGGGISYGPVFWVVVAIVAVAVLVTVGWVLRRRKARRSG